MKVKFKIACIISAVCLGVLGLVSPVFADTSISLSPLSQKLILSPGETYEGSFNVVSQADNKSDLQYMVSVEPFFVDENYEIYFEETESYNQMVDWITVDKDTGVISPGNSNTIHFTIRVPENAPAGGQYAAIKATTINNNDEASTNKEGANINVQYGVAYTIYADVTGATKRSGEIQGANVPSFLLSGNVSGSSTIVNNGNVHGTAKYTLQIFPLFSSEEIYTNEEKPDERNIMPERSFYNETVWDKTPDIGIFNVKYTVEFEGVTTEVSKMVIKCPIWLMFIIIFVVFALIFYFVAKVRARKKTAKK